MDKLTIPITKTEMAWTLRIIFPLFIMIGYAINNKPLFGIAILCTIITWLITILCWWMDDNFPLQWSDDEN